MRINVLCIFVLAFAPLAVWSQSYSHSPSLNHKLKPQLAAQFKTAWAKYMPGHDPSIFIAQCYQESRFNPYAISPVGAQGICQFMPGTWRDMQKQLGITSDAFHPGNNIRAAAYYNSKLFAFWYAKRPYQDHINLMLASFNAGAGNMLNAQKACANGPILPSRYQRIIECLPCITGHHAKETIDYVDKINRYRTRFIYARH